MAKFEIVSEYEKSVKRYGIKARAIEFKIKEIPAEVDQVTWIKGAMTQIINYICANVSSSDIIGFTFCSKEFSRGRGYLSFKRADSIYFDDIWDLISGVYQSNSSGLNTETFCLEATIVSVPTGKGKIGDKYNSFEEECAARKGIISIQNTDNLCLPRSLVVGIAKITNDSGYNNIRRDTGKIQLTKAKQLMQEAEVEIDANGAGIPELKKFQSYFGNSFKIVVYNYGSKGRELMFEGDSEAELKINLLYYQNHYNVITSLTSAFVCSYYCEECHIPYNNKGEHTCVGICSSCTHSPPCDRDQFIKCPDCRRYFVSKTCFDNHKTLTSRESKTICEKIFKCETCYKVVDVGSRRTHICNTSYCKCCNKNRSIGHLCYMPIDTSFPKLKDFLFIFYDLECTQDTKFSDSQSLHEPNVCVFNQRCDVCIDEPLEKIVCIKCGVRQQILKFTDVIETFVYYILDIRKKFKNVVVLAHNGQAYDHQFILNYILTKTHFKPELIMRGSKIISMTVNNIKLLDSLNFFPMSLAKLPKAFGLAGNFKKGFFPYHFNTAENQNYVGKYPDIKYYNPDAMTTDDREKFINWYNENKDSVFDMQKEIVSYCISDVNILTLACIKFRQLLIKSGNVCPYTEAYTIASSCNKLFRRNFLKADTIGLIPRQGYRYRDNQSKVAIQWLLWEEKVRKINIVHAAKQQEIVLGGLPVDGYCAETNQIFEMMGCFYHGCVKCFKNDRDKPVYKNKYETMNLRYENTLSKINHLRELGYEVVVKWECEFNKGKDSDVRKYVSEHPLAHFTPLNARDSFYGGRTGNIKSYYKVKEGEKINYIDICSLYPWVCKYGKFPIGHPKVLVGEDCLKLDLTQMEGIIKCKVLPPQNLFHPVLPIKLNNKLMFPLCYSCAKGFTQEECHHVIEDRAFVGTWVVDEIVKALANDYKIIEIYEIWNYETEQYDGKSGGLFREMMNKFIKIKQEASGWPLNCVSQEDKIAYIDRFFEKEGIELEYDKIVVNPGLRSLAKLILNSFFGKFGQRENQSKTHIVNQPAELYTLLFDPAINVVGIIPINEETLVVNYHYKDESFSPLSTVNVSIAAYVTAQARLRLYSYMEKLGERVLYFDTDSIIYISREGEYEPKTGDFLGDMTNELECYGPGSYITEFASGGPKNYAFVAYSPTKNKYFQTCKVKGISINHEASKLVNFDTMKNMIINEEEPKRILYTTFERTEQHQVLTSQKEKIFRPNLLKRRFSGYNSYPYGYKKVKE
ncbi:hypothetical protein RI129_012960 [Pyrocoelia pectoralis]|uniref:DNA-directed DNA polymerase n=1 Tax=Pyrocoelia pectoralis TaxID=417401 RepID=A0AAN7UV06_9COLE